MSVLISWNKLVEFVSVVVYSLGEEIKPHLVSITGQWTFPGGKIERDRDYLNRFLYHKKAKLSLSKVKNYYIECIKDALLFFMTFETFFP
jgi:hypothetical protein